MTDGSGNLFGWAMEAPTGKQPSVAADEEDDFYMLDEHRVPVRVSEEEWSKAPAVEVASTDLREGWRVLTVFDGEPRPAVAANAEPFVFCTTLYSPGDDCEIDAYSTWEEAEVGHQAVVDRYRKQLGPDLRIA